MAAGKMIRSAALAVSLLAASLPVSAQAPELAMLDSLNKGEWNLRIRSDGSDHRVCVRSGLELVQIRHTQNGCSTVIIEDGPRVVTVQYTCRGDGYGRTTIRKEGSGLVQIRSQGTQGGLPFSLHGEVRHTGGC